MLPIPLTPVDLFLGLSYLIPKMQGLTFVNFLRTVKLSPPPPPPTELKKKEIILFLEFSETCERPGDLQNGRLNMKARTKGTIITFTCNEGYWLNGNNKLTCEPTLEWSGKNPTCVGNYQCVTCATEVNRFQKDNEFIYIYIYIYTKSTRSISFLFLWRVQFLKRKEEALVRYHNQYV